MRLILYLALVGLAGCIVGLSYFGGFGAPADQPGQDGGLPDGGLRFNLVWIIPLSVFGIECWLRYRRRWYYWRGGGEIGTFSAYQLNQLYKTGQIDSKTPIRQVKDDGWYTGLAMEDPPRRIGRGLCYGLLAGLVGFFLSYALCGHVQGRYLSAEQLFREPTPIEIGTMMGLTYEQMREAGLIRLGLEVGSVVPSPLAPGAGRMAEHIDHSYNLMVQKVERAKTLTLGGTALLALLGAAGGAITAIGRARIIKERRVVIKKRDARGEAIS
jgi:hypothetical protein